VGAPDFFAVYVAAGAGAKPSERNSSRCLLDCAAEDPVLAEWGVPAAQHDSVLRTSKIRRSLVTDKSAAPNIEVATGEMKSWLSTDRNVASRV
jgi:hypothetical protein